jgi:proteic killer suppression protein
MIQRPQDLARHFGNTDAHGRASFLSPKRVIPSDRTCVAEYKTSTIRSFKCNDTEALFNARNVPRFKSFERQARRRLLMRQAATELASLKVPPGNHLEALVGDRKGQHSIRISNQWRPCFVWRTDASD